MKYLIGFIAGLLLMIALTSLNGYTTTNTLKPCPTEDSTHCYWDASEQGNGLGHDFINP